MFRPSPSYLVSSLCLSQSNRRVGSSDRSAGAADFFPGFTRRATGALGAGAEDTTAVDAEGEGELGNNRQSTRTTASTVSETAAMVLFRFSVPICIKLPSLDTFPGAFAALPCHPLHRPTARFQSGRTPDYAQPS